MDVRCLCSAGVASETERQNTVNFRKFLLPRACLLRQELAAWISACCECHERAQDSSRFKRECSEVVGATIDAHGPHGWVLGCAHGGGFVGARKERYVPGLTLQVHNLGRAASMPRHHRPWSRRIARPFIGMIGIDKYRSALGLSDLRTGH